MITKFLSQDQELEAFITGPAGSGKTTALHKVVEQLNKDKVNYQVVAYTHKAKDVLISKLPENTPISTLHSWLKKRPGINEKATHMKTLMTSKQYGKPEHLELLIVDEFSFVGEKDYFSIGELQDEFALEESVTTYECSCGSTDITDDGLTCIACAEDNILNTEVIETVGEIPKPLKVLYVGDLNQLSPIDGPPAVSPIEPFWTQLTTIYRTQSQIQEPLAKLVQMIEGIIPMAYLEPNEDFKRAQNIDNLYKQDNEDKIMLAYTNEAVQKHNATIQGYKEPKEGDRLYSSTLKKTITIDEILEFKDLNGPKVELHTMNGIIGPETKYNPMRQLKTIPRVKYYLSSTGEVYPGIFGSYHNKVIREQLGQALTKANKSGKNSKTEYKRYKVTSDYVANFDFTHCMTIHKSQGSEYINVYVDSADLARCFDKQEMMKLLYVSMSRSKNKIFLNN